MKLSEKRFCYMVVLPCCDNLYSFLLWPQYREPYCTPCHWKRFCLVKTRIQKTLPVILVWKKGSQMWVNDGIQEVIK